MVGLADCRPIRDMEHLARLYGQPNAISLAKEVDALTPSYRALVEASRFCVLATAGPGGLDCSPRGDGAGVVRVVDERTLLLPDRRGNNRIDSLRNIITDPRVALLFFVPPLTETLRVNGRAVLTDDADLCGSFAVEGSAPKTVVIIHIESVFWQCARALVRSGMWQTGAWADTHALPTPGRMLAEASEGREDGAAYDSDLRARQARTLY